MEIKTIHSIKEDIVVKARSLQQSKERFSTGQCLIEGEEQILWAIEHRCPFQSVFIHDKQKDHPLIDSLKKLDVPLFFASDGILKKISDTSYLVPFIAIIDIPKTDFQTDELVIVLDGVKDFGNIGTIVRTAQAFGIKEFISTHEDFDWFYKKAIDASRGTIFSSHLFRCKSEKETLLKLKEKGYQIAVTTIRSSIMQSFAEVKKQPIAIVFGNETHGVSPEIEKEADLRIQIPMSGPVESLNVAVAAGISLYELKIKWILTMLTKKIQESIGRDLFAASHWMRLVFDTKLKETTPLNADQAIMMMILKCDGQSDRASLTKDAGTLHANTLIEPLIHQKLMTEENGKLFLSEKGEEFLAKIWSVHELTERLAFENVSEEEKQTFLKVLHQIFKSCEKIIPYS